jgi:hypothetical protein
MRYCLISLLTLGLLSGCLSTHNTDGKHRPDEAQHIAHIASYNKFVQETSWKHESPSYYDEELNLMQKQALDAWDYRDRSWLEYQRKLLDETSPVKSGSKLY